MENKRPMQQTTTFWRFLTLPWKLQSPIGKGYVFFVVLLSVCTLAAVVALVGALCGWPYLWRGIGIFCGFFAGSSVPIIVWEFAGSGWRTCFEDAKGGLNYDASSC